MKMMPKAASVLSNIVYESNGENKDTISVSTVTDPTVSIAASAIIELFNSSKKKSRNGIDTARGHIHLDTTKENQQTNQRGH